MVATNDNNAALARLFSEAEIHPETRDDVLAQESFADKLKQCRTLFGQPFQALDLATQNAVVWQRLRQLVNTLRVNPLWRERLAAAGFSGAPERFEDWQRLPITDRETLNTLYMGQREGLVIPLDRGGFEVIASGGTSGGLPIETVYSQRELHDTYAIAGEFLGTFVLPNFLPAGAPRWIITTLHDYEMWSSGTMIGGLLQRTPGVNFVAAGPMSEIVYDHVMSFAGAKAIMGMSREIEGLISLGEKLPRAARESFRLAIYGSGIIQPKKVEQLKEVYPHLQILSYFASNQAEAIGMQLQPDGFLTSVPGLHFIEIVDAEGKWVEVGQEGELLITRLHATEAPILRMQLGDRMVRRPDFLSPTLNAEQFDFAGRSSDILHLGESHYSAQAAYANVCENLHRAGFADLARLAQEVQFQNNRTDKVLHLVASLERPDEYQAALRSRFSDEQLRACFIEALKGALSLFDRTEQQFSALERTPYRFDVQFVAWESPLIHRTRVGKVPLIRDRF